jgi:methylmalonic aciduria homocystinuria type C protein
MPGTRDDLVGCVKARCAMAGLDLVQPFRAGCYDGLVEPAYRLPDLGGPDRLAILVGNTRALWPRFIAALRTRPALLEAPHPLDAYVMDTLESAARELPVRSEVRGAHEPPPRRVAMQAMAHCSGLAWLSPSHLNIHPVFGPWIALRGVIVVDLEGPPGPPPSPQACEGCADRCVPMFAETTAAIGAVAAHADIERDWQRWLAVRDACPIGAEHRYSDEQIRYHYTKDRTILRRLVSGLTAAVPER